MDDLPARPIDPEEANGNLPGVRQAKLLDIVRERGQVTVGELVSVFGVSRDTIRRDLTLLEQRGLLVRTHGGAMPGDRMVTSITTLTSRMHAQAAAKQRIGVAAAGLIRDGETLMLNGGSSTTYFAAELGDRRDLTIVTNNLRVLPALPERCLRAVYVLGGSYLPGSQVMVGFAGFAAMPRISVDTAVIGATGIAAAGCSIGKLEEALATQEMMAVSRRTILLADSSKFGVQAFALVASFGSIEHLVTDAAPGGALAEALEEAEVQVCVADQRG